MHFSPPRAVHPVFLSLLLAALAAFGALGGQGVAVQQPDPVREKLSPLLRSRLLEAGFIAGLYLRG